MKYLYTTIQVVFITLMLGVAGLFLLPLLPIENNLELRIVESGSMEPQIMTGSLVAILPAQQYGVGDVITFRSTTSEVPTTHRIVSVDTSSGATVFTTKGDANEENDTAPVALSDVLGTVVVPVPYAGFILDFARQPMGFAFLIVLPAVMIIFSELEKIWVEVRARRRVSAVRSDEEDEEEVDDGGLTDRVVAVPARARMMDVGTPVHFRVLPTLDLRARKPLSPVTFTPGRRHLGEWATFSLVLVATSMFMGASFFPYTVSYLNDIERSSDNLLRATMLDFSASSDGSSYSFLGAELDSENSAIVSVIEPVTGSAGVLYDIEVEFMSGNEFFCNAILAESITPVSYSGPFMALSKIGVALDAPWALSISIDEAATGFTAGDICQADVVYTGWHEDEVSGEGYFDIERVPLTFYAPAIALPLGAAARSTLTGEVVAEEPVVPLEQPVDEVVPPVPQPEPEPELPPAPPEIVEVLEEEPIAPEEVTPEVVEVVPEPPVL